jgi:signal transduction histidine kinase
MTREPFGGLTIRAALLLGFGLTLGLWLFSGYYFTRRMNDLQGQSAAINTRYMQAQELLSIVRAQILMGSVYVRDALLDPDPAATEEYRRQLQETYKEIDRALRQYVPVLDSQIERRRVAELAGEIEQFRATMLDVLASDSTRWPTEARLLLRSRIVPKRDDVIRVSEDVQAMNRSAFVQHQAAMADVHAATQQRVWTQLGLALAASFVIGLFATRHVSRLEDRLRRQRAKDVENTRDLQRLSAQLVTVQEEERRTIARELHDEVGQVLTAIKVELAVAERAIETAGGPVRPLRDARSLTDGALHTVRDLSRLLHPALLDDLGLAAAVDSHLREFSKRHSVRADLLHEGMEERVSPEIEAAAYRVVQEALTNVARHARATAVRVYLQRLMHSVLITIEDNGVGFDPESARAGNGAPSGLGLLGIRERAAQLRGTLRVESTPGKGTRLTVELPARPRSTAQIADAELAPAEANG